MTWTKLLLESKTFWWIVISAIGLLLKNLWIELWDQTMIVNDIMQIVWLILALYWRISAKEVIK